MARLSPKVHVSIGIVHLHRQTVAAIEGCQLHLGVIADGVRLRGQRLPVLARRQRRERQVDALEAGGERTRHRLQRTTEDAFDLRGQLRALAARDVDFVARHVGGGVLVGAAADRDERDGAGVLLLDRSGGEAGPVAADEIVRQRHRVVGVASSARRAASRPATSRPAPAARDRSGRRPCGGSSRSRPSRRSRTGAPAVDSPAPRARPSRGRR